MSNRNKIKELLASHPEVFIDRISFAYPLPELLADKYRDLLNWRKISENRHITVSLDFFNKHESRWVQKDEYGTCCSVWMNNNSKLWWSDEFLERYKDRILWNEISRCDDRFSWTEKLIERFFNYLSWEGLSSNESLPWSYELLTG